VSLAGKIRGAARCAFGGRRWIASLAVLLAVEWSATGVRVVREDQQGVVLHFGAVSRVAPAGILFTLPWPIDRTLIVRTTEVRTMPVGYKMVDARRGIAPAPREVEWVTGDTNIIDLTLAIKYAVGDPVAYVMRAGPGEADFLVRRCAEAALTRLIATMSVEDLLTRGKFTIQEETRRRTQSDLDSLGAGVRIVGVTLGEVQPPSNVIQAFNDVATAKSEKAKAISDADGYRRDLLPRARAQANRTVQDAESYRAATVGRAQGDASQFDQLRVEAARAKRITEIRLYLEAMARILPRARKLVLDRKEGTQLRLIE
jgi:membrane protease subunit HflK